jgi:hypothetical protein
MKPVGVCVGRVPGPTRANPRYLNALFFWWTSDGHTAGGSFALVFARTGDSPSPGLRPLSGSLPDGSTNRGSACDRSTCLMVHTHDQQLVRVSLIVDAERRDRPTPD